MFEEATSPNAPTPSTTNIVGNNVVLPGNTGFVSVPSHLLPALVSLNRQVLQQNVAEFDFNVKVINEEKKKEFQTFVLRRVKKSVIATPELLRKELFRQFGDRVLSRKAEFAVGFFKNGSKVTIRCTADMDEIWKCAVKGDGVTLWCYGARNRTDCDDNSDDGLEPENSSNKKKKTKLSALEEKNERIESLVTSLHKKQIILAFSIDFGQKC